MQKFTVEYDATYGTPISDGLVDSVYGAILGETYDGDLRFSTDNIINRMRVGVKEGQIEMEIRFDQHLYAVGSDGFLPDWPRGLMDASDRLIDRLLD